MDQGCLGLRLMADCHGETSICESPVKKQCKDVFCAFSVVRPADLVFLFHSL